jgi:alpha-ribazole phosphatase
MTLIDLLRHGETELPGRLLGRTDAPLSRDGWQQFATQTTGRTFDAIVSSPRQRAWLAAEHLAKSRNLPLRVDDDWAELDFGDWDGLTPEELQSDTATAQALAALYASADAPPPPRGEAWSQLQVRVGRALDRLIAAPESGTTLVVTHAGPIRAAIALSAAIPFSALWALRINPGTRITLQVGHDAGTGRWGEIVEVVQP